MTYWGEEEDIHPNQGNNTELPIFSPPDPGFFQNTITNDKIFDLFNLVEMSDTEFDPLSTELNIFSDTEASEVLSNTPPLRKKSDLRAINFQQK